MDTSQASAVVPGCAVVGIWSTSPFGAFADVMVQLPSGQRLLLAPRPEIADFIQTTYTFDDVMIVPVHAELRLGRAEVQMLRVEAGPTKLGRLVPHALAVHPRWLKIINPLASVVSPGVRTAGTALAGRQEFYGVSALQSIKWALMSFDDQGAGPLAQIKPAVRFGFSSVRAKPSLATVQTTIVDTSHTITSCRSAAPALALASHAHQINDGAH